MNVIQYYEKKESEMFPDFSEKRREKWNLIEQHYHMGLSELESISDKARNLLVTGFQDMEKSTGLQFSSALSTKEQSSAAASNVAEKPKLI
jgi:hypothetical protein